MLKDDKYFEAFKRNLLVTATTHGGEEILERDYMPGYDDDSQELFKKNNISCTVFSAMYNKVTWAKPLSGNMNQLWMQKQYGRILRLTYPHNPKDSMKGIDCMAMDPLLSMIDHGKSLLNNLFSISMNNLGN